MTATQENATQEKEAAAQETPSPRRYWFMGPTLLGTCVLVLLGGVALATWSQLTEVAIPAPIVERPAAERANEARQNIEATIRVLEAEALAGEESADPGRMWANIARTQASPAGRSLEEYGIAAVAVGLYADSYIVSAPTTGGGVCSVEIRVTSVTLVERAMC